MTVFSVEVSVDERNPSRSCGHAGSEIRHTFMGTKLQGKSVTEVSQMLICPIANNAAAGGSETVRVFKERHLCACVSANPSSCDGRPTTSLPCSCDVGKMTVGHTSAAQIKRAPHHTTTKTTTPSKVGSAEPNDRLENSNSIPTLQAYYSQQTTHLRPPAQITVRFSVSGRI